MGTDFTDQAAVVQKLYSAVHRMNLYPVDNAIGFPNTYPLDGDSFGGWRYPTFEQLGPGARFSKVTITFRARKAIL